MGWPAIRGKKVAFFLSKMYHYCKLNIYYIYNQYPRREVFMNRIVSLTLPAAAAFVFFLIACGDEGNSLQSIPEKNGQADLSSSSPDLFGGNPPIGGNNPLVSSSGQEQGNSSSSTDGKGTDSSSSLGSSSSDANAASSSGSSSSGGSSGSSSSGGSSSSSKPSSSSTVSSSSSKPGSSSSFATVTTRTDFKDTVGSVVFDMIYIPGGTFTLGCESGMKCQTGAAKPVDGVKMSDYFIMKAEATSQLWTAVMGSKTKPGGTWYEAVEFACELSKKSKSKRNYHLMTEAEFEYAAKRHKDKLSNIGGNGMTGEEWAYNSWDADKHTGGTDPVGPGSGSHTQKTRRDADSEGSDRVTSRLIRSIDGIGPATRLVVSADFAYPPGYVPSCDIHPPVAGAEPANSYRDPRWVTEGSTHWKQGTIAIGTLDLTVWEDGTAKLGNTNGQWFTSNNISFVFVPSSGSSGITKFAYIFLDDHQGSIISDKGFMNGGFVGRFEKESKTTTKPSVSNLMSGENLAKAQTARFDTEFKMVDMTKLPKTAAEITSAYSQDQRLLDGGAAKGWFQDNTSMQGAHHYRKDIDLDAFRFTVNQQGQRAAVLAAGKWFTVNNTFLRVIHSNGYIADYLYTIADKTFYHNSYMGYEKADFRMFEKVDNNSMPSTNCGAICGEEIPKDVAPAPMYVNDKEKGQSTFVPAPCPSGGCR